MLKKRYKVNLPAQQAECEANYHRLQRLMMNVCGFSVQALSIGESKECIVGSSPANDMVIRLIVVEQTKYTTLLRIIQLSSVQNIAERVESPHHSAVSSPKDDECLVHSIYDADVRLYHDVALAEIISCQQYQQLNPRYHYPNEAMHQVNEKALVNQFLSELLAHCLVHGRVADCVVIPSVSNKKYA